MNTSRWDKIGNDASCLVPVLNCWLKNGDIDEDAAGVSASEIDRAEHILGRKLPIELRALYQISDGFSPLGGNLEIVHLFGESENYGLTNYSDLLREWNWPVPNELVVFGGNGADALFGIWLPSGVQPGVAQPVVELGESFETSAMAIVGTSLSNFLRVRSAFYMYDDINCLDLLEVPAELRGYEDDDALMAALYAWGDPAIPDCNPDPYDASLTSEEINQMCAAGFAAKQHTIPALTPKEEF